MSVVVAVGVWGWMCEEGLWFSFVWGGSENELGRLLFIFLYPPPRQPAPHLIRAAYSSSLCPMFGNPRRLSYPDGDISKREYPLSNPSQRPRSYTVILTPRIQYC